MDAVFAECQVEGRLASLEVENRHLRAMLLQAHRQADSEQRRNARLGRIVAFERTAGRVELEQRVRVEAARIRAEAEDRAVLYRRDIADGAARLASAEELNGKLRASEEFNRRILWTTTDCVKVLDLDGRVITVSENGPAVFGTEGLAGLIGRFWAEFWTCPGSRAAVLDALERARAGRANRFQAVLGHADPADGPGTWWDIAVTPIDGADGRPERILAVSRDITDLKRTEERQGLLMQELAHRVKNTLALVQAVAAQTLRNAGSLAAAGDALDARLRALAGAHDVLMQGAWASASLAGIVDGTVALHGDGTPGRFRVTGPDLTLAPQPAMTLALMLHELATNAAKYGALSTPGGHVAITWSVGPGPGDAEGPARLDLAWVEAGGPPVAPPVRTGFGSRLISRSLAHSFGGSVRLTFPPSGAILTLQAPLAAVVTDA